MERMVRIVGGLQTKTLNMAPHRLTPVKAAATHLHVWQHLTNGLPHCCFKVAHNALYVEQLVVRGLIQQSLENTAIVGRAFATHDDISQRHLLDAVIDMYESVYGPQLCKRHLHDMAEQAMGQGE